MLHSKKKSTPLSPPGKLPEFKISLRFKNRKAQSCCINDTVRCAEFARSVYNEDNINWVESFFCIMLSNSGRVMGFFKVSSGGVTGCFVDAKVVFQAALLSNATSIILTHNHPSGNLTPSTADIELTYKLQQAGESLDIKLLDHIIITDNSYFSFADHGLLRKKNQ